MTQLLKYEKAREALAAAVLFDDVLAIKDLAKQAETYARLAKDNDLIEKATEIRVRAERKAGAMLTAARDQGVRAGSGGSLKKESPPATLSQIGITNDQSSRWQQLASMSEDHFEAAVATAKDTAGQVTTAFMLRESAKHQGKPKKGKKAEQQRQELREAQERGVSMLCSYARMTIKAIDALDQFTDEERQVLEDLRTAIDRVSSMVH